MSRHRNKKSNNPEKPEAVFALRNRRGCVPFSALMEYFKSSLKTAADQKETIERIWRALYYCKSKRQRPPDWLYEKTFGLLSDLLGIGSTTGPTNHAKQAYQFRIDSIRTKAVEDARRAGASSIKAWRLAADKLAEMKLACSQDTIRKSYQKIQRHRRFFRKVQELEAINDALAIEESRKEIK